MSARTRRFRLTLTPDAQSDIPAIQFYGLERWGERQADDYITEINHTISLLRDSPKIGVSREDFGAGFRSFPAGSHVIFYRIRDDSIEILRILHERADAKRHFSD